MLMAPLGYALYLSLFRDKLVGGRSFVGLQNYGAVLTDEQFRGGVVRVVAFFFLQVPLMMFLAVLFALVLDTGLLHLARSIRLSIFLPFAIPSVVAALMWGFLYGPDYGPLAQMAEALGGEAPPLLTGNWILLALANIVTWQFVGYNMIILVAALRAVPVELYEAARIDGAGEVAIAWRIKIPLVRNALLVILIFSVIGTMQLFTEPKILQALAPSAIGKDFTPNMYAYALSFAGRQVTYAAAVSFILGAVTIVMAVLLMLGTRSREKI
jgi:multiple sugar transport system permease protein